MHGALSDTVCFLAEDTSDLLATSTAWLQVFALLMLVVGTTILLGPMHTVT